MAYLKIRHREKCGYVGGKYHDDNSIHDVLSYIMDPTKTPSRYIGGIGIDPLHAEFEMVTLSQLYAQDKGVRLRHMILAFEEKELWPKRKNSLYFANCIAFQVASFYGGNYQIVYAVHEDTKRVHIHFVMNTTNYMTGLKYEGKKADLCAFIQYVNNILEQFGSQVKFLRDDEEWTEN